MVHLHTHIILHDLPTPKFNIKIFHANLNQGYPSTYNTTVQCYIIIPSNPCTEARFHPSEMQSSSGVAIRSNLMADRKHCQADKLYLQAYMDI